MEITVPVLGESIVEATIANWMKQVGDRIEVGEAVAELETDKVNVEVIAESSGTLQSILKAAGDTVHPGEAIAVVEEGAATAASAPVADATNSNATPTGEVPSPYPAAPQSTPGAVPNEAAKAEDSAAPSAAAASLGPVRATPAVRRLAHQLGVDVQQLANATAPSAGAATSVGAAPQGVAIGSAQATAAPRSAQTAGAPSQPELRSDEQREPMSRRRITIARRLVEVQHSAAMLTTFNEVDMSKIMDIRKRRKESFKEEHGIGLGFMSFFTKAAVAALKAFPRLNAEIQGNDVIMKYHYDIGIAVSAEAGLVVPVVRNADKLRFADIEREIARLAEKARSNALSLEDLQGGTFTITNGGIFGSLFSTPILNAPQVGILGMHGIQQRPIAVNGQIEIRPMMYLALSYDHRIVDGSEAVRFLVKIKQAIEDPETLLLEG